MKIHICLRRTLDWTDREGLAERLKPEFRPKAAVWDETFDMSYGAFRQRLKEIALANHDRVEGVTRTPLDAVPHGDLIVPVDDDDWFAPHLAREIRRALEPEHTGIYWIREVLSPSRRRRSLWKRLRRKRRGRSYTCKTNNYAVINTPELTALAAHHKRASEYFDAHPARVVRIPKVLAIQNRNLASQTSLAWRRPTLPRAELIETFERYRRLYRGWKLPRDLRWAAPCMEAMAELMDAIHLR